MNNVFFYEFILNILRLMRKYIRHFFLITLISAAAIVLLLMVLCNKGDDIQKTLNVNKSAHHTEKGFRNPYPEYIDRTFGDFLRWVLVERRTNGKGREYGHYPVEKVENDGLFLRKNNDSFTVTWVGHSTLLIQLEGITILTDPTWSDRASPFQFAGPTRHAETGIAFEAIPPVDMVIISHDHYDHLDKATIRMLGNTPFYVVPLGLGTFLEKNDIDNYRELDWWDAIYYKGLEIVCTPSQHFSGRMPFNRDNTLWCSWVINGKSNNFYFCGDSGYFSGFNEIGERYGPFDLVCLPIGSYLPKWFMGPVHMSPKEALQVCKELIGKKLIPIHWGTFRLAGDPHDYPPVVLLEEIKEGNFNSEDVWILKHGETRVISSEEIPVITGL